MGSHCVVSGLAGGARELEKAGLFNLRDSGTRYVCRRPVDGSYREGLSRIDAELVENIIIEKGYIVLGRRVRNICEQDVVLALELNLDLT